MNFVNRDGRIEGITAGAGRHPLPIVPVIVEIPDDRCGFWRSLGMKRKRVSLIDLVPVVTRYHVVFVSVPVPDIRDEALPDSRRAPGTQIMAGIIPSIERTHHGNALRIRRPDGKIG